MQYSGLFVRGLGRHIPRLVEVADAVADGRCPDALARRVGIESVAVSDGDSPPDMAVRAAQVAVARSGVNATELSLFLHATGHHQGQDSWSAAAYVQDAIVGDAGPGSAIEIRQMSNGGMAALELAASYLSAGQGSRAALITTGDRYELPAYDRWRSDPGMFMADGASALVLDSRTGFARLLSVTSWSDPRLEKMHRGNDPFTLMPFSHRSPVDMEAWRRDYLRSAGYQATIARLNEGSRASVTAGLEQAGWKMSDVDWFVLPNIGQRRLEVGYFDLFGIDPEKTTWSWGRRIGHMGAGDQFAGLEHLVAAGRVKVMDRCALLSVGAGFTWSCACIEILRVPRWG